MKSAKAVLRRKFKVVDAYITKEEGSKINKLNFHHNINTLEKKSK